MSNTITKSTAILVVFLLLAPSLAALTYFLFNNTLAVFAVVVIVAAVYFAVQFVLKSKNIQN
jgi:hypothetical protein